MHRKKKGPLRPSLSSAPVEVIKPRGKTHLVTVHLPKEQNFGNGRKGTAINFVIIIMCRVKYAVLQIRHLGNGDGNEFI